MNLVNDVLEFWSDWFLGCVGDRPSSSKSKHQQDVNNKPTVNPRIGIDSLPSGLFRDLLSIKDLVRLSLTNKTIKFWCELALRDKKQAVDESVRAILSCPTLEYVQLTNRSSRIINDGLLHLILFQVSHLTTLILSGLDSITDDAFEGISKRPQRLLLTRLELRNMRNITNQALLNFINLEDQSRNSLLLLSCLCIERCQNITEEGIVRLFNVNLEHVQLKSFPYLSLEITLDALSKVALNSLRTLDVSNSKLEMGFLGGCRMFTKVERIEANYTNCRNEDFEQLRYGQLKEEQVTDRSEEKNHACSEYHTQIKRLTLNGCANISNSAMIFLPSSLTYLNLSQTDISDDGISMFIKTCSRLEHLFLGGCYHVTSLGITCVAQSLDQLKELGFSYCYQVEDDALEALERHSSSLIKLSMVQCGRLSMQAISNLVRKNHQLKSISCTLATEDEVTSIIHARCATVTEGSQSGDWVFVFRSTK